MLRKVGNQKLVVCYSSPQFSVHFPGEHVASRSCMSPLDQTRLYVYLRTHYIPLGLNSWIYSEDLIRDFKNLTYEEMWKKSNPSYLSESYFDLTRKELIKLYHDFYDSTCIKE